MRNLDGTYTPNLTTIRVRQNQPLPDPILEDPINTTTIVGED